MIVWTISDIVVVTAIVFAATCVVLLLAYLSVAKLIRKAAEIFRRERKAR